MLVCGEKRHPVLAAALCLQAYAPDVRTLGDGPEGQRGETLASKTNFCIYMPSDRNCGRGLDFKFPYANL